MLQSFTSKLSWNNTLHDHPDALSQQPSTAFCKLWNKSCPFLSHSSTIPTRFHFQDTHTQSTVTKSITEGQNQFMAQKHKDTKPFKSFWKNTKKEVCHYNVTISKLLPSVSRDKNHPQAADELTRYMLITGGKFIRTIRQYSLQNWQSNLKVLNASFVSYNQDKISTCQRVCNSLALNQNISKQDENGSTRNQDSSSKCSVLQQSTRKFSHQQLSLQHVLSLLGYSNKSLAF